MRWPGLMVFLGITLTILSLSSLTFATGLRPPCDNYGDVDFDGFVTARDKLWVLEFEAGLRIFSAKQIERADVNDDPFITSVKNDVSSVDALFIDQYIHGLIDTFPVCKKVPICGNNKLEFNEQCDDGNRINGDGCNSFCKIEFCGDGIKQKLLGEQCDDNNFINGDGCSAKCKTEFCGDGIKQKMLGEECDDGNFVNGDGCSAMCKIEIIQICGDGKITGSERCDDGNRINGDGCDSLCRVEFCGDGIIQKILGEQCDDHNNANKDGCDSKCKIEMKPTTTTTTLKPTTSTTTTFPTTTTSTTTTTISSSTTTTSTTTTVPSSTTTTIASTTTIPSCVDECTNERFCTNNFAYKVCGNFDGDSCLELGLVGCGKGEMCNNGFCVQATYTGCVNECSSWNIRQCSGNGYRVCGNWDSDSCFEWGQVIACSNICKSGRCV